MTTATLSKPMPEAFNLRDDEQVSRWAIVLSGGEAARAKLQKNTADNARRPRQYCVHAGNRTPLQQTLDRAGSMVPPARIVTIIGRDHRKFLVDSATSPIPGSIIEQPLNLGTLPGILLPAAFVSEIDPDATIIILPSDHFVHPESLFLEYVTQAFQLAEQCPDRLVLVGAAADRPETDYGWVVVREDKNASSTETDGARCLQAIYFLEKPELKEANTLLRLDCLWSTMVVAVKARTLWTLARKCLPSMVASFDAFRQVLSAIHKRQVEPKCEGLALADLYERLRPADFSKDILERVPSQTLVVPMDGVTWCDWARPRHLTESLVRIGRQPSALSAPLPDARASRGQDKSAGTTDPKRGTETP